MVIRAALGSREIDAVEPAEDGAAAAGRLGPSLVVAVAPQADPDRAGAAHGQRDVEPVDRDEGLETGEVEANLARKADAEQESVAGRCKQRAVDRSSRRLPGREHVRVLLVERREAVPADAGDAVEVSGYIDAAACDGDRGRGDGAVEAGDRGEPGAPAGVELTRAAAERFERVGGRTVHGGEDAVIADRGRHQRAPEAAL